MTPERRQQLNELIGAAGMGEVYRLCMERIWS